MKFSQCRDGIELQVIEVLRRELKPTLRFESWQDYLSADVDPRAYSSAVLFKKDYAYVSFLRKWKGFKNLGLTPTETAEAAWLKAEYECFRTNKRLFHEASTGNFSVAPDLIVRAQRKIARVLGRLDADRISELCRFGNGATSDLRMGSTHAEKSIKPTVTLDAIPWVCRVLARDEYLGSLVGPLSDLKITSANRMVMVPKTAKTHRPIAAEPTLNSYVQQGFGRYIRKRLKRFGVDLDDQTINQDLASVAQRWGLATLDLSSASDTLCTNLVKLLLPREWYEALDSVRCSHTSYGKRRYFLSKFSSMGNAYTFELESLIFYALVSEACSAGVSSVYGDDLIVHSDDFQSVVEILTWGGFSLNLSKSFSAGNFFESCGKHYFCEEDVTPCFQKEVCTDPHGYVRLHNRLVRAGIRLNLRKEFGQAAKLVREDSRVRFGARCPGIGPLVEYDEYFVKEDFTWDGSHVDRVRVRSCVTVPVTVVYDEGYEHIAYLARKLRSPSFLNTDPRGQCSDVKGSKLLVREKYHWRSSVKSYGFEQ